MTYLIPDVNGNGNFKGDLTALGVSIDASGGWWDAGDYLKFTETTSYVVGMMETDVRDFPSQLGPGSATANYSAEAAFGLSWLEHMWNDSTKTLYLQVGIGAGNGQTVSDHDIWRLPQVDDTYGGSNPADRYIRNRPVFRAAPPGSLISPNLAGRLAADFALCYQLDRVTEPAQAAGCLRDGEDVFALADTHPGRLQTAVPYGFYPEKEWRDDLEWGATELYDALSAGPAPAGVPTTDPMYYLRQAAHWAHAYITGPYDAADSLNLYDVSGLAHYELFRAIEHAGHPSVEVTGAATPLRPGQAARQGRQPERHGSLRLRIPLGHVRHDHARRRPRGHGLRIRRSSPAAQPLRSTTRAGSPTSSAPTRGARR